MPSARFRPHERIADKAVFQKAFQRKKSVSDAVLIVYGVENGLDHCRVGISASKRRIRRASDRNRVKRFLREAFRLAKSELPPGLDLIIVPRNDSLTFAMARDSLPKLARSAARRLGLADLRAVP